MLDALELTLVGLAAVGAGIVNALAGGGSLITFPTLVAVGIPALAANVTNTVALCPGYIGATLAQAKDLHGQRRRMRLLLPAGLVGGVLGGILLLETSDAAFRTLVPFLILSASALLAVQGPLRSWLMRRAGHPSNVTGERVAPDRTAGFRPAPEAGKDACGTRNGPPETGTHSRTLSEAWAVLPVGIAAIYGGYFGAGLSVIVLAVLGLLLNDNLTRLNALKQAISFSTNLAAAIFFLFSGKTVWSAAAVMAVGALIGGVVGGRLAGRVKPAVLRAIVVAVGTLVGLIYLWRL